MKTTKILIRYNPTCIPANHKNGSGWYTIFWPNKEGYIPSYTSIHGSVLAGAFWPNHD